MAGCAAVSVAGSTAHAAPPLSACGVSPAGACCSATAVLLCCWPAAGLAAASLWGGSSPTQPCRHDAGSNSWSRLVPSWAAQSWQSGIQNALLHQAPCAHCCLAAVWYRLQTHLVLQLVLGCRRWRCRVNVALRLHIFERFSKLGCGQVRGTVQVRTVGVTAGSVAAGPCLRHCSSYRSVVHGD